MKVTFVVLLIGVALAGVSADWRIVGGETARDGQFPYQVSVRIGNHNCGGSILDETTILSGAHCINGSSMIIVSGSNKLDEGGDTYKVKSYIIHENFDRSTLTNNIALIKLENPIQFNSKVQPVELRKDYINAGEDCILSGWGSHILGGSIGNDLKFIKLNTLSHEDCLDKQNSVFPVVESEICTLNKFGEGACHGDLGGPLVDSHGRQFGIGAWATLCAVGKPDVFTRISSFWDWIEDNRY